MAEVEIGDEVVITTNWAHGVPPTCIGTVKGVLGIMSKDGKEYREIMVQYKSGEAPVDFDWNGGFETMEFGHALGYDCELVK